MGERNIEKRGVRARKRGIEEERNIRRKCDSKRPREIESEEAGRMNHQEIYRCEYIGAIKFSNSNNDYLVLTAEAYQLTNDHIHRMAV